MAYMFAGFFASPVIRRPASLPEGAVWREIVTPFEGVGVSLPDLLGKRPPRDEVEKLVRQFGMDTADRWIYLTYDCWAGQIDFVYGLGTRGGVPFGPVEEDAPDAVESAYTGVMAQFGVSAENALMFAPFKRGFWGET